MDLVYDTLISSLKVALSYMHIEYLLRYLSQVIMNQVLIKLLFFTI